MSLMIVEDCGQNDKMLTSGSGANSYINPTDSSASLHWRWANPDIASGQSKRINSSKKGGYGIADEGCMWVNHDCGPNSEMFSFHGNGAYAVFADGHVSFLRESLSKAVLRALATRADGKNEAAVELD
jgi:prepilin-type processing-associated H-X9-DG protein